MRTAATNAASSGVTLDRNTLKSLGKRSDHPGLVWLTQWAVMLAATGTLLWLSLGTWWALPATLAYGTVLTVPTYSLSHECAHGTAFRSRWLNEVCLWIASLIYYEEPYHRRWSHTRHHTYTWHEGLDSQMPFETPMTFMGWLGENSGLTLVWYETKVFAQNATGRFAPITRAFTPESELPRLKWSARACLAIYAALAVLVAAGVSWPLTFLLIPRLAGGPVMLLFTLIQHVEMRENTPSILESTRSFRTGWLGRFLYMNMNNHVEHHLYPQIPFHALPGLSQAIASQLPQPDPGFFRTNWEVLQIVTRRSLGLPTKAPTIR